MRKQRFPKGWDEEKVRQVLAHYEAQTDEQAAAEDTSALKKSRQTLVQVPTELMPVIREILAQHGTASKP
jgi:hypothetical protein